MEYSVVLEVEYPEPTLRACSIQGHVSSSQATHEASFSANQTAQKSLHSMSYHH